MHVASPQCVFVRHHPTPFVTTSTARAAIDSICSHVSRRPTLARLELLGLQRSDST